MSPPAESKPSSLSIALTGSGGSGVMSAGEMLLKAAARHGLHGVMGRSYGPQIRGGEAAALLRLANWPVQNQGDRIDVLMALDWINVERFRAELPLDEASLVIFDPAQGAIPDFILESNARQLALPLAELAKGIPGGRSNMIGLGFLSGLAGLPRALLEDTVCGGLSSKGETVLTAARESLHAGCDQADRLNDGAGIELPPADGRAAGGRWLISGNEAAATGALRGGLAFCAAYPITPSTDIVEWLAGQLPRLGGQLVQAEDELATINMCLGASFGGKRAMTATSGPGLSLMSESIGLAVASETPVVIINVMRGGPSTGIPTRSEQSDLNLALYGTHGDAPHLVIAPNSIEDCVHTTQWSLDLAEALQCPAIVLNDQSLAQTRAVIAAPGETGPMTARNVATAPEADYERYGPGQAHVPAMAIPGTVGGEYTAEGLSHDRKGRPSSLAEDHIEQLDRRRDKLLAHDYGKRWADVDGDAPLAILTWGSLTGPVREALSQARAEGMQVRLISLRLLAPALPEHMQETLSGVERLLVVEQSHGRQFEHYLRANYELPPHRHTLHRPGPINLRPGEILHAIRELAA